MCALPDLQLREPLHASLATTASLFRRGCSRESRVERSFSTLNPELSTTARLRRHFVDDRAAAPKKFIARYRSLVTGVLSGFDRLVFRGSLLPLFRDGGTFFFLERAGVRLLDFKDFVTRTSDRVKEAAYAEAARLGRPVQYLESSESDKEKIAKRMLADQPIDRGLICVLTAVEPCMSFEYHRSCDPKERGLRLRPKKCLHLYKYFVHPHFGFMSARLQTWFPFNVQICLNGREWAARQLPRQHLVTTVACRPRSAGSSGSFALTAPSRRSPRPTATA